MSGCGGNNVGSQVPVFAGGGGTTPPPVTGPDRRGPCIIVGNAPAGDTTDDCDILDPGDGTGIAAAITQAGLTSGDIWIRCGTYDFSLGSSPATPLVLPFVATQIRGAGPSTILNTDEVSRTLFQFLGPTVLSDMTIQSPAPGAGAVGDFILDLQFATSPELRNLVVTLATTNGNESLVSAIGGFFSTQAALSNLRLNIDPASLLAIDGINAALFLSTIDNCRITASGTGVVLSGSLNSVSNCTVFAGIGYNLAAVQNVVTGGTVNAVTTVLTISNGAGGCVMSGVVGVRQGGVGIGTPGAVIEANSAGNLVTGNTFNSFQPSVEIQATASRNVVTSNIFNNFAAPIEVDDQGDLTEVAHNGSAIFP